MDRSEDRDPVDIATRVPVLTGYAVGGLSVHGEGGDVCAGKKDEDGRELEKARTKYKRDKVCASDGYL